MTIEIFFVIPVDDRCWTLTNLQAGKRCADNLALLALLLLLEDSAGALRGALTDD